MLYCPPFLPLSSRKSGLQEPDLNLIKNGKFMSSQNLYHEPTPLDKQVYKNLRIKSREDLDFAKHLHSAVLAGSEFFAASHNYPVMFVKNHEGNITPIAVLSLTTDGHNLGDWKDIYVPMFIRRYPFVMDSKTSVLYFDKQCPLLQEGEGEPLFEDDGEPSQFLKEVLAFNKHIDDMYKKTSEYVAALVEKDLLEPYKGKLELKDQTVSLERYLVIDEKKFNEALSDEEIATWFKNGWLAWTYAHMSSTSAMGFVVRRLIPAQTEEQASE